MEHIEKKDLKDGQYYVGVCRNTHVALWDAKKDKFVHIRNKFGHMLDEIEHFDDVKDKVHKYDGFIPLTELAHPKLDEQVRKYIHKLGY